MISFILAQICCVLCIAILIAGVVMVKKKDDLDEKFDAEWMDETKWKQTK